MSASLLLTLDDSMKKTLKELNLTEGEYRKICVNLNREPNANELAMFSVLWSEHCCYKNSRHLLRELPTTGPRVLHGPGENAGVVDAGDGIGVAFKIESHNHPTAVEPYQGAATGVGGILRDIFTMNARPVANLNALRFGPIEGSSPQEKRNKYLFTHAVKGIGDYGNCVGVPTIGGDVFFEDCYSQNPLVNAMAIGVVYDNEVMPSRAIGVGNPVLYVGSATGKDGMGGAAFASRELDEQSADDRPAVQVGDPFAEKLLIEACLEAFATGCVASAQDMGAAGLTSSSCEMASKGKVGMRMDLDKVPAREPGMKAYEYLLSESQERMLMVLEKGKEQPVLDVFAKWRVPAVIIGEVTELDADGIARIEIFHHGEKVVDLPARLLTDLAPSYERGKNPAEPEDAKARRLKDAREDFQDIKLEEVAGWLDRMVRSPNIAQPVGVWSQYDRHVRNNTMLASENMSSGVIRLRKKDGSFSGKALAATVDCNPRYIYLEPYRGTMMAVAEAARNLVCVGAEPMAVTDNLNFGNPEKSDIYYQLYYAVQGIKDACNVFQTPVTGGNVSLYNEHSGQPIYPTPVIGMVGLIEDDKNVMSPVIRKAGLNLGLLGRFKPSLGGSEYQKLRSGKVEGNPPDLDLNVEKQTLDLVLRLIRDRQIANIQDVSTGGLLITLLEMLFNQNLGAEINVQALQFEYRLDEILFGETAGTYILAYPPEQEIELITQAGDVPFLPMGQVTAEPFLSVNDQKLCPLEPVRDAWRSTLVF